MTFKHIQGWIKNFGLLDLQGYVHYENGHEMIDMDGEFTLDELKEIVSYMEEHQK